MEDGSPLSSKTISALDYFALIAQGLNFHLLPRRISVPLPHTSELRFRG
jgi:hypothetical protein